MKNCLYSRVWQPLAHELDLAHKVIPFGLQGWDNWQLFGVAGKRNQQWSMRNSSWVTSTLVASQQLGSTSQVGDSGPPSDKLH